MAKLITKNISKKLMPCLMEQAIATQYGGLPGRGTDVATHIIGALLHYANLHSKNVANIFADIKSAFYSVIRQLVFNITLDDTQLTNPALSA